MVLPLRIGRSVCYLLASPRRFLLFFVPAAGSMALVALAAFPTNRVPRLSSGLLVPRQSTLTWESPNADGPVVAEHAELHFLLDNPGRSRVKVLGIDTSCGCVKPVADPPDVKPGGTTKIVLKATTPSTGTRAMTLVVHTDSQVKPDVRLTARILVRRKPPFLYGVSGDLTFRGTFSPDLAGQILVVTFESGAPTVEPKISTDLPFLEIGRAEVSDEPLRAAEAPVVGRAVVARERKYKVGFKEPPPDPVFIGTIKVTDPFGKTASRSLNVLGQLDPSDAPRVVPRSLTLPKKKGTSGWFMVICNAPSQSVTCSVDEPHRADFSINAGSDDSSRRIHKIEVVIVDPAHLSSDPVRLKVREPHAKAEATVLLHFIP